MKIGATFAALAETIGAPAQKEQKRKGGQNNSGPEKSIRADAPEISSSTATTANRPVIIIPDNQCNRHDQNQGESKHGSSHFCWETPHQGQKRCVTDRERPHPLQCLRSRCLQAGQIRCSLLTSWLQQGQISVRDDVCCFLSSDSISSSRINRMIEMIRTISSPDGSNRFTL